eukprot:scaffold10101_cov105-Isochrysis_galbana.AAC.3
MPHKSLNNDADSVTGGGASTARGCFTTHFAMTLARLITRHRSGSFFARRSAISSLSHDTVCATESGRDKLGHHAPVVLADEVGDKGSHVCSGLGMPADDGRAAEERRSRVGEVVGQQDVRRGAQSGLAQPFDAGGVEEHQAVGL